MCGIERRPRCVDRVACRPCVPSDACVNASGLACGTARAASVMFDAYPRRRSRLAAVLATSRSHAPLRDSRSYAPLREVARRARAASRSHASLREVARRARAAAPLREVARRALAASRSHAPLREVARRGRCHSLDLAATRDATPLVCGARRRAVRHRGHGATPCPAASRARNRAARVRAGVDPRARSAGARVTVPARGAATGERRSHHVLRCL